MGQNCIIGNGEGFDLSKKNVLKGKAKRKTMMLKYWQMIIFQIGNQNIAT